METENNHSAGHQCCRLGSPFDFVSAAENVPVNAKIKSFTEWAAYPFQVIIVPGFTPLDALYPLPMHAEQSRRVAEAKLALEFDIAPFVLVSGGNCHPSGTPFNEALQMKGLLLALGVREDQIIVEAMAQHSTTNLRNAGRHMLLHGMKKVLIITSNNGIKSQNYYFSHPVRTMFNHRSRREMNCVVGKLYPLANRTVFEPSRDVWTLGNDPYDP